MAELKAPPVGAVASDSVMVSVEPVPEVTTLPKLSSTETPKLARADPAVPVVGGSGL